MIQARMVQAGRLRPQGRPRLLRLLAATRIATDDPEPPDGRRRAARVAIEGDGELADDLRDARRGGRLRRALRRRVRAGRARRSLIDAAVGRSPLEPVAGGRGRETRWCCVLCVDGSLAELDVHGGGGRVPRAAAARGVAAGRADPLARTRRERTAHARRGVLPLARQARRVGRRRARARARADRLPARERGRVRGQRGRRLAPRTSTSRCATATTTRAGRSSGPT